ncbi:MAG: cyclase family protein [Candidatus Omnitrophota bacterium]
MGIKRNNWIDATLPIDTDMISWPSDPVVKISEYKGISKGGSSNVLILQLGSHAGTHIDAPRHFLNDGTTIDAMPADVMVSSIRVIEIKDRFAICADELKSKNICLGQSVIFRTINSKAPWWQKGFCKDFVFLSLAAAEYLVSRRVRLVGIDALSIGGYGKPDGKAVHQTLLDRGIWIVEGLDLTRVRPGRYNMLCLPLKIYKGDAAPARVLLKKIGC